eukprot:Gb_06232 [translate_table: standard]
MPVARPLWNQKKNKMLGYFLGPKITQTTKTMTNIISSASQVGRAHGRANSSSCGTTVNGEALTHCKQSRAQDTLHILNVMDQRGIQPDNSYYSSVLQGCVNNKALPEAKLVHAHMIQTGFEPDLFLETKLVIMYAKCRNPVDARRVLDEMPERNVVSWTAVIAAYAKDGYAEEALRLFHRMKQTGIEPNDFTFASVLPVCANFGALKNGKEVHEDVIRSGFQSNIFVGSALVHMYVRCRNLENARKVFDRMPERDVILCNAMIAGYAQHGQVDEALKLFHNMPERNVVSWNAMIAGYAQNGHADEALKLFQTMPEQNVVTWNAMIAAYSRNGHDEEAVTLFHRMQKTGVQPDQFTFASVLAACANLTALEHGKDVHQDIIRHGFQSDVFVGSALVDMYAKCGSVENARKVFENMPKRNVVSWNAMIAGYVQTGQLEEALKLFHKMPERNVVSWNSIIAGYVQNGHIDEALKLFQKMPERGVVSWNVMIAAYSQHGLVDEALKFFQKMPVRDVGSWNAMIAGYAQNGCIDEALQVFDNMPERNVVSWNSMISGYAQNGFVDEALNFFQKMPERNELSWNSNYSMISGYTQNGCVDEALNLFQATPERNMTSWNAMIAGNAQKGHVDEARNLFQKIPKRDMVSWNAVIAGYAQNGHFDDALKLFQKMQQTGGNPNLVTFVSILPACANLPALEHGKVVHEDIIRRGLHCDIVVGNALVDMYAKCGSIENGRRIFDRMPERDVISWSAMILGYGMHGLGKEAVQLFEQMELSGTKPNNVTFIGVLTACCHSGLVDDGLQYFDRMSHDYHLSPAMQHYCCMVDLLGRAGYLEEAQDFVNKMPMKPDAAVWGSLLAACRIHTNIELGEHVAERLFELDPENAAPYVLLSNIYAVAGRWDDVEKVRKMMKGRNVKKMPGQSWIEVNNKVYTFLVGDKSHPQAKKIYAKLERLSGQMKEAGYVPNTNFALHDVEEEQKEHILCLHSEKLAIAFGLINTSPGIPIRIVKNLRVCGDCHSAAKFISKIDVRNIVIRDANRFHHFTDGHCSCGDYW